MFERLRPQRPSHATVVAYLALFIALGGTSFAAVKLSRNAVKSRNIAPNAVTSSKVKDKTLGANDFAPGVLGVGGAGPPGPQGARGERGPQGERGEQGATGTPDTSNFYDKAASDLRFLQANGTTLTNAQATFPDFDTLPVGNSRWQVWYTCPDVANPSATNGAVNFRNLTAATVNLFVDNGGGNPSYVVLQPFATVGDIHTQPANAGGEAIDFDAQGFTGGRIAHVHTVSVNRSSDCHFQVWAIETLG